MRDQEQSEVSQSEGERGENRLGVDARLSGVMSGCGHRCWVQLRKQVIRCRGCVFRARQQRQQGQEWSRLGNGLSSQGGWKQ